MGQSMRSHSALVLVVDDDDDLLELAAEVIRRLGYHVITAHDGAEAFARLQENDRIGVLFSDIRMPGMDGEKLANAALEIRPDLRVILTSGTRHPPQEFDFLPKPYRAVDLINALPPQPIA